MNGARHQFLARAALAGDEHRAASPAGGFGTIVNPPHRGARAKQAVKISPLGGLEMASVVFEYVDSDW